MEKIIKGLLSAFMLLLLHNHSGHAQAQKGLIRTQLTISPAYQFAQKQGHFYLHGNLEGYVSNKISFAGEGYYYLGSMSPATNMLDFHHTLFFGASRHFTHESHDVFIGLQPGISVTRLAPETPFEKTIKSTGVNPLFSTVLGYNFYINHFMHYFMQSRLVLGNHHFDRPVNLAEFRFSAGLGFNLYSLK